jgi:hypothetical protein
VEQLEFALIPIGIVLGYGVTKVLGSWAHVIHIWNRLERLPVLFLSSTALSLCFMYMNFSGLWAYRSVEFEVTQGIFNVVYLFAITLPMLLFMLAVSVLVPPNLSEITDLEAHFLESVLAFNLIFSAAMGAAMLADFLPGIKNTTPPIPALIMITIFVLVGLARSRAIHLSMHAALWLFLMAIFAGA